MHNTLCLTIVLPALRESNSIHIEVIAAYVDDSTVLNVYATVPGITGENAVWSGYTHTFAFSGK